MPIATPLTTWRAENVSWYKRQDGYKRHLKADYKRSYSFLRFLMKSLGPAILATASYGC